MLFMLTILGVSILPLLARSAPTALQRPITLFYETQTFPVRPIATIPTSGYDNLVLRIVPVNLSVDPALTTGFVNFAHANGKTAGVTVGGSPAAMAARVADANRTAFASELVDFASQYQFDALDINWSDAGITAEQIGNLAALFTELRQLNSAIRLGVELGAGAPSSAWNDLAQTIDVAWLMAIGFWNPPTASTTGAWNPTTSCPTAATNKSVQSIVSAWSASGFPVNKLSLAITPAAYSYSGVRSLDSSTALVQPVQLPANASTPPDVNSATCSTTGVYKLVQNGQISGNFQTAESAYTDYWDDCTESSYMINPQAQSLIAYESPRSVQAKVDIARQYGLGGVSMFCAGGDTNDLVLTTVAQQAWYNYGSSNTRLIALWVMIPIIVIGLCALCGAVIYKRRRQQRQQLAQAAMVEFKSDGGSSIDEKQSNH